MREFYCSVVLSTLGSVSGSNFSVLLGSRHQKGSIMCEESWRLLVLLTLGSLRGSLSVLFGSRDETGRKVCEIVLYRVSSSQSRFYPIHNRFFLRPLVFEKVLAFSNSTLLKFYPVPHERFLSVFMLIDRF